MSKGAFQKLLDSLTTRHDDWSIDHYNFRNTKTRMDFWIANGVLGFCYDHDSLLYPPLTIFQRFRLWGAVGRWRDRELIRKINLSGVDKEIWKETFHEEVPR